MGRWRETRRPAYLTKFQPHNDLAYPVGSSPSSGIRGCPCRNCSQDYGFKVKVGRGDRIKTSIASTEQAPRSRRVKIILTCNNAGGGHKAAVAALTEIFQQQNRPWDVKFLIWMSHCEVRADPLFS